MVVPFEAGWCGFPGGVYFFGCFRVGSLPADADCNRFNVASLWEINLKGAEVPN